MSTKLQELFEIVSKRIINRLEEFYEIGPERIEHINNLLSATKIRSGDDFSNIKSSYVMVLPRFNEKGELTLDITLFMPKTELNRRFISTLYHEIVHIISIGLLRKISSKEFFYRWGICSTRFYIKNGVLYDENYCEMERLNESLVDLCAEYFYTQDTNDKYQALFFKNPIMRMCHCEEVVEMKDVIVPYILNDSVSIRNLFARTLNCTSDDELNTLLKEKALINN